MAFLDFLFGKSPSLEQVPTMNPQQMQLLQQILGGQTQGQNYISQLLSGSPEAFQAFESPYMRQFQERTIPQLAERFAGLGAQSSSGFQQALGQAGAGLSENLASLRSGLQMQSLPFLQNYQQLGLQTSPFAYQQNQGSQGILPLLLAALGGAGGQALGVGGGAALSRLWG